MKLGAVVLAAGQGRRMGGNKALLLVDGCSLVRRHVARLREVGCAHVVVVVPTKRVVAVREELGAFDAVEIVGADTSGQAESLAAALSHVAGDVVVVTPVDLVPPRAATMQALLAALTPPFAAVTPTWEGQGGHPVVIRREWLVEFERGFAPLPTLHDVLRGLGTRRLRLPVDDAAVLGDLDTPQDLPAPQWGEGRGEGPT